MMMSLEGIIYITMLLLILRLDEFNLVVPTKFPKFDLSFGQLGLRILWT